MNLLNYSDYGDNKVEINLTDDQIAFEKKFYIADHNPPGGTLPTQERWKYEFVGPLKSVDLEYNGDNKEVVFGVGTDVPARGGRVSSPRTDHRGERRTASHGWRVAACGKMWRGGRRT